MNDIVIGQLVQSIDGKTWRYAIVTKIYDDRCETINEFGGLTMVMLGDITEGFKNKHMNENGESDFLYSDGKPVMAKKTLFGKYKFEPSK